nr:sigma-70 family RNA polymerase sigma factor [Treponema sp.]
MELENQHLFDHGEYLLKLALKKVDNFEQAEDLVSETYISALSAIKNGKQIENPQAYLSGILNHKFEDFLRSKYSKPVISYGVIPDFGIASDAGGLQSALDKLIKKEDEENVRRIIAGLSKNYREVLVRHFIYGQNVKSIAVQLKVKTNTVKSRLNTARMNVKSEMEKMEMEKYEKQSYEPEQLEIWVYGEMENDCSAFYTNDWTRRIQQNILIMAYKKPLTITELSLGLGISAAYIEPIVEELISYDFMARKGDKVFTSFIIFTQKEKDKAYDHDKALAEKYAQKMWGQLELYLEQIRNLACYKKMNERQRASLLQFSAIFMIHEAVREIKAKKIPKPDVMNVEHEAKWQGYAYGFQSPLDYKPDWDYVSGHDLCKLNGCHVVATGPYKKYENVRFYAYSVAAGFTFSQFWPLDHLQFLKVCYALYSKEENDIPLIAPKFFDPEVIETYEKYNFLEKRKVTKKGSDEAGALKPHNGDLYVESLNLPVLQDEDEDELFKKIYHPCILDFAEKFHSELEELLVNPVEVP